MLELPSATILCYSIRIVKDLVLANDSSQIKQVIYTLEHDFTLSSNPNSRKGGLVGLAAASIALGRVSFSVSHTSTFGLITCGRELKSGQQHHMSCVREN